MILLFTYIYIFYNIIYNFITYIVEIYLLNFADYMSYREILALVSFRFHWIKFRLDLCTYQVS